MLTKLTAVKCCPLANLADSVPSYKALTQITGSNPGGPSKFAKRVCTVVTWNYLISCYIEIFYVSQANWTIRAQLLVCNDQINRLPLKSTNLTLKHILQLIWKY